MTATIHRIHARCAAEASEAYARAQTYRDVAELRYLPPSPRTSATIKQTRRQTRILAGLMAIILAALIGAVMLESAWTASIAASLAE